MSRRSFLLLLFMAIFAVLYNLTLSVHPDEAYYWQWSRHLALSYLNGPPLTAYLIRIITTILGSYAWSLKLTAIICMTASNYFIYRLAKEIFNERTAFITLLILILLPITQAGYVIITLDPPLICFWSLSLYWFYLAISRNNNLYRYLTAVSLGLALLAKYPAILLAVSFFVYLLLSHQYRKEFKNINWYGATILALLIFSPVIIWNWQHDWAGFIFQYHHGVARDKIFQLPLMLFFISSQLGVANPIFLIAVFYFIIRYGKKIFYDSKLLFLSIPFLVTFLFFFYQGMFKISYVNWTAPAYVSASVLIAYFINQQSRKKLLFFITLLNIVLFILVRFPILTPFIANTDILVAKFYGHKQLFSQVNRLYKKSDIVISNSYQNASEAAFYLKGQPQTYIITPNNTQYYYWSKNIKRNILNGKIKSALYIGDVDSVNTLEPFCRQLIFIKKISFHDRWVDRELVIYHCLNT